MSAFAGRTPSTLKLSRHCRHEITVPRFQIAVHQSELISRWQEPPSDPVEAEIRAQGGGCAGSAHAASMSRVFCFPAPTAVPRAPAIARRKHPMWRRALIEGAASSSATHPSSSSDSHKNVAASRARVTERVPGVDNHTLISRSPVRPEEIRANLTGLR